MPTSSIKARTRSSFKGACIYKYNQYWIDSERSHKLLNKHLNIAEYAGTLFIKGYYHYYLFWLTCLQSVSHFHSRRAIFKIFYEILEKYVFSKIVETANAFLQRVGYNGACFPGTKSNLSKTLILLPVLENVEISKFEDDHPFLNFSKSFLISSKRYF